MAQIEKLNARIANLAIPMDSPQEERELNYQEIIDTNPWSSTAISEVPDSINMNVWESDEQARSCRICERRFGLLVRRHHCRKCGQIICDKCSPWKVYLNSSDILQDPSGPLESLSTLASRPHRVCEQCYYQCGYNHKQ